MSDQDRTAVRYVEETTRAVTPTAAMETIRCVSAVFDDDRTTEPDQDLGSRRTFDHVRTARQASGRIDARLRYGDLDDLFEGALCGSWTADRLDDATTRKYYTFEKEIADVSNSFMSWVGHAINELTITIPADGKATVQLSTLGNAGADTTATVGTGAAVAAATTPEMVGADISAFTEGGGALTRVRELSFTVNNNLRREGELGSRDPGGWGLGRLTVTGRLRVYFQDFTLWNKFTGLTESSLVATVTDTPGNSYTFNLPEIVYTSGRVLAADSINETIFYEAEFEAREDVGGEDVAVYFQRSAA